MSCPDPLHDYEDWTDENGKEWKVGYDNNDNEWIPVDHGIVGSDSLGVVPENKQSYTDALVAFHQHSISGLSGRLGCEGIAGARLTHPKPLKRKHLRFAGPARINASAYASRVYALSLQSRKIQVLLIDLSIMVV